MKLYKLILLIILISFSFSSIAIEGSYKTFFSDAYNPYGDKADGALSNVLRTKFTSTPNDSLTIQGAYALTATIEKTIDSSLYLKRSYRVFDLESNLYPSNTHDVSNMVITQNIDRLNFAYVLSNVNINIGRQPVAFGSAKAINPTDVLTPFSYQDLDKEDRVGVDAARMNISLGSLSLLDFGYVIGEKFKKDKSALFARYKVNVLETDVSTLLMDFKNNLLLGIDISRSIGKASSWLEMAQVNTNYFDKSSAQTNHYFRGSLGADYKWTSGLYGFLEYHYNGAGERKPSNYSSLILTAPYVDGGVSFRGVHYIIPGFNYEITPLWKLTGQFLYNINDSSALNNLLIEHSMAQDVFIDVGTYLPIGKKAPLEMKSEFGNYPKIFYTSVRLYF